MNPAVKVIACGLGVVLATTVVSALTAGPARPAGDTEGEALFRAQVFPVLQEHCFRCHGPGAARIRSGLLLNGTDSLLHGGDRGPAVVPGDANASLIVQAVRRTDPDLSMPPRETLDGPTVAAIERWVTLGAPWPADLVTSAPPAAPGTGLPAAASGAAAGSPAADAGAADAAAAGGNAVAFAPPTHDELQFFENEVRPLLAQHCYECHGPELKKVRSGLRMSGRATLLRGGERGPALVPGKPDQSRLIEAVRWTDADLSMPPDNKLTAAEIATLENWVTIGAPWPPGEGDAAGDAAAESASSGPDLVAGRQWWSFRPVVRPEPPATAPADAVANPIDAFVLAPLQAAGLQPNPPADRAALVRRAYFDLIGLPPSAADVQAFVHDDSPDAWSKLVDRLLAMPEYGERWGRHWLDVVRWAQTNGYERDTEKPFAWRYRDWVIKALNDDKPYDRFVLEQLAGDELPDGSEDSLVATGFYRLGVWDDEPDDEEQAGFDELDDQVRIISEGFLGVTLGCARCHDHKFDPFAQTDYYSTLAFLRNVRHYTAPRFSASSPTLRPLGFTGVAARAWEADRAKKLAEDGAELARMREAGRKLVIERRRAELPEDVRAAFQAPAAQRTPEQSKLLAEHEELFKAPTQLEILEALGRKEARRLGSLQLAIEEEKSSYEGKLTWVLAVREARGPAPETHVLVRGRASSPAQPVEPHFVSVLCASDEAAVPALPAPDPNSASTGRRLALARWITSPEHPTTARVMVNRIWQHHFGRGLVETPNDFGRTGAPPGNQPLLDWLASEFVQRGWSIKEMHRLIMNSNTYRLSSRADNAAAVEKDPDNLLLWRQGLRRVEAEVVRDTVLAVAGTLSDEHGGRGFFPRLSREALAGASRPGQGWELAPAAEGAQAAQSAPGAPATAEAEPVVPQEPRSVYGFVKRSLLPPLLEVYDYGNTSLPVGSRSITTLASQALILLNSEFMGEQSAAFAARVRREAGDDADAQITRAFELALARAPDETERGIARDLLRREAADFAAAGSDIVFRARVPSRLDVGFLPQLSGADVLFGPRDGWTYLKGHWGNPYNGTLEVDKAAGPVALLGAPAFGDGVVTARLLLQGGCELAALVLHARADGDEFRGVEVVLDPLAGKLRVVAHAPGAPSVLLDTPGVQTVLAEADAALAPDAWQELRVAVTGRTLSIWWRPAGGADDAASPRGTVALDGTGPPLLQCELPADDVPGLAGIRAWGEALRLSDLQIAADGAIHAVGPDDPGSPGQRALQSLCLLLFNLDEFVYVD